MGCPCASTRQLVGKAQAKADLLLRTGAPRCHSDLPESGKGMGGNERGQVNVPCAAPWRLRA